MFIKLKNKDLKVLVKCLRIFRQPEFQKLVNRYCSYNQLQYPDKKFYYISLGENGKMISGFWALVRNTTERLRYAEKYNCIPYIYWGKGLHYYDENVKEIDNVFEYFYKQATDYTLEEINKSMWYFCSRGIDRDVIKEKCVEMSYVVEEEEIDEIAQVYEKYFQLNGKTQAYITKNIENLFPNERILGVHIRGTDFKKQFKNHPTFIEFHTYVDKVKSVMNKYGYSYIFIATDDKEALQLFINEFGEKCLFYKDCERADGDEGIHFKTGKNTGYYKGLEVLRDVYTLVACESVVLGLSQVSFGVRYVKKSLKQEFLVCEIIDSSINY